MQSIYTIDLETENDPLCRGMVPDSVFRIANFDHSVTTRTIVQCLSDVVDSTHRPVNFELYWCDDTTCVVAASRKPTPRSLAEVEILREHGRLILAALKCRFPTHDIVPWVDFTARKAAGSGGEADDWSSRFGRILRGLLGWPVAEESSARKKREGGSLEGPDEPHPKRRKIR